jgi:hypothetical protein
MTRRDEVPLAVEELIEDIRDDRDANEIWRRLLVRSDSTITDLHYILQIGFGWSDEHLNRFHIDNLESIRNRIGDIGELREWLTRDSFDRRAVNHRLKQYATHDESWMWQQKGAGREDSNTGGD